METEVLGGKPSKNKEKGKKITTKTRIINWKKKAVWTKNLKMHLTWSKVYVEIAARKILRVSCLKFWIKQSRFGKLCCLVNLGIWNIYQLVWFEQILYGKPRSKYFFSVFLSGHFATKSHFQAKFFYDWNGLTHLLSKMRSGLNFGKFCMENLAAFRHLKCVSAFLCAPPTICLIEKAVFRA